jgi:hypothetical protein
MENQAPNQQRRRGANKRLIATVPRLEFLVTRSFKRRKHFLTATRTVCSFTRLNTPFHHAPRSASRLTGGTIQNAFSCKSLQIRGFQAPTPSTSVPNSTSRIEANALLVLLSLPRTLDMHSRGRCPVSSKERRATRRFLMRLPLTVRWTDESVVGEAMTESREVSSRGLYFHLPKGLRSGSPVEIVMTLPHELTQAGPVRVRCLGRVLRSSSEHSGEVGVAAAIERYEFMRNGENAA